MKYTHLLFLASICGLIAILLASQFEYQPAMQYVQRDSSNYRPSPTNEPLSTSNSPSEVSSDPLVPTASPEPTPKPQMSDEARAYWLSIARNAWQYFQPGIGVDAATGLHYAAIPWYNHFTDWDIGCYITAIVEASKLGILEDDGAWGLNSRVNKVLYFLETRALDSRGAPYDRYSTDGTVYINTTQVPTDTANLLVGLKNLELHRPEYSQRINNIVNVRTNYELQKQLVSGLTTSVNSYDYFVVKAFAEFWPERFSTEANSIMSNIINANVIVYQDVALPKAKLTWEPILLSIFGFSHDPNVMNVARQIYLAHEAYNETTGYFVAFSEGNPTKLAIDMYLWEWVVLPDGSTWVAMKNEVDTVPIIKAVFLKAAVGMDAIYGTQFTQTMTDYMVQKLYTTQGYKEGISETYDIIVDCVTDKTNSMILSAARYALEEGDIASDPSPTPTPNPTPTASPLPTITTTQKPNPTPTVTPMATPWFTVTPTPTATPMIVYATTQNGTVVELYIAGNITGAQFSIITITNQVNATALSFTLTGPEETAGFGNLTVTRNNISMGVTPTVYIDNQLAQNQGYAQDADNFYVWWTTHFSVHQLSINFTAVAPSASMEPSPTPIIPELTITIVLVFPLMLLISSALFVIARNKSSD
jgi:hypothetical protein